MNGTGYCTISSKLSLSEREISSMLYQVLGRSIHASFRRFSRDNKRERGRNTCVIHCHSEDSEEITSEKGAGIHASFRRFRRDNKRERAVEI